MLSDDEPTTVTADDMRRLSRWTWALSRTEEVVMVETPLGLPIIVTESALADSPVFEHARVLLRCTELPDLMAEGTKHVERYQDIRDGIVYGLNRQGATLAALLLNRRLSDVVNGRPVKVIGHQDTTE